MTASTARKRFSIGWDVGGWNCDKNPLSRDAIVILDDSTEMVAKPWRGNLRKYIASAATTGEWLKALFGRCGAEFPSEPVLVAMAIDAPLGFSKEFIKLITRGGYAEPDETSGRNRYLFRHTERYLFDRGLRPLSPVKDMIGSQATKGMHVLAKFAPQTESCGVWTDGHSLRVIETYPTAWRKTRAVRKMPRGRGELDHRDLKDAWICALVAHLFASDRGALEGPHDEVPQNEGWIWVPQPN